MSSPDDPLRPVWFLFALTFAVGVGIAAGVLTRATGQSVAASMLAAGVAFAGALGLALAVVNYWRS